MISLVLEAATYTGSVALLDGARVLGDRSVAMRGRDREALMAAVGELLAEQQIRPADLGRVVCGAGPGSFTSLRIAGGIAKGIAMAANIPLIPVSSLALLLASQATLVPGRCLVAMDALRDEHYVALFEVRAAGDIHELSPPSLMRSDGLTAAGMQLDARIVGLPPGPAEARTPRARAAATLMRMIEGTAPADLAAWEPAYGRLAEAQVKWEATHGRPMVTT